MTVKNELRPSIGPARLAGALRYSIAGFRHATRHEAAFQQELLVSLLLLPAAVLLPVPTLDRLILVLSMMLVIVVELLNSAIEATVDRISAESPNESRSIPQRSRLPSTASRPSAIRSPARPRTWAAPRCS